MSRPVPLPTKPQPSLDEVKEIVATNLSSPPNLVPVTASLSSEFLTPSSIYLRVSAASSSKYSFLFESAATTGTIGTHSFIGTDPRAILKSGPEHGLEADPLPRLQQELNKWTVADIPSLRLPPLTGGAIGYVGYDCVRYFEPKTAKYALKDVLKLPESWFGLFDTIVAVDHFFQKVQLITYMHVPPPGSPKDALEQAYQSAVDTLKRLSDVVQSQDLPLPQQSKLDEQKKHEYTSNIGRDGYCGHVRTLREHIIAGDIIQAVPSQRLARPTDLHPFNIYRTLRTVNPSPYLFYISCNDFQIVGASPELLVQSDPDTNRVITHPIAGTVKRGTTADEDNALAQTLRDSLKDRAEHVMLVDLARNDVNRVCDPLTTRVEKLMVVQKFSHVQHLVSEVSGILRPDKTRFDAFRSIFPAGTVSGAPKVRAMELIASLEKEKRGVYAGAVGYFGYPSVNVLSGKTRDGAMDTCIALRTMVVKHGVAYLQAGGGIVFDSEEEDEYQETLNKVAANVRCIDAAEERTIEEQKAMDWHSYGQPNAANYAGINGQVDLAGGP